MRKIILTFSLFAIFSFVAHVSVLAGNVSIKSANQFAWVANVQLEDIEAVTTEIMEEAENNKVPLIIIASLAVLLILFILFWLGARDRAKKRRIEAKDATTKLAEQTAELTNFKQETLKLRSENSELTVLLEKEKTKTESLNDQIQKFETQATALNTKMEELQNRVKPTISEEARKEIDSLEVKAAKIQNIAKLKADNSITEAEANEMKALLLKDLT